MTQASAFRHRDLDPTQSAILDGYFGRGIIVKPAVVRALKGNGNAAILLSQMVYLALHHRYDDRDGWFWNTREELEAATGLSPDVQTSARKRLVEAGLIETSRKTRGGRLRYRVNLAAVAAVLIAHQSPEEGANRVQDEKRETPVSRNGESRFLETGNPGFSITKTSTKTSTDKTSSPPRGGDSAEREFFETFRARYNEHRGQLTRAVVISPSTERNIRGLVKRYGAAEVLAMLEPALSVVREDPHWLGSRAPKPTREGRPYGIENLVRHLVDKYNLAVADSEPTVELAEGQEWTTPLGLVKVLDVLTDGVVAELLVPAPSGSATRGTVTELSRGDLRKLVRA